MPELQTPVQVEKNTAKSEPWYMAALTPGLTKELATRVRTHHSRAKVCRYKSRWKQIHTKLKSWYTAGLAFDM